MSNFFKMFTTKTVWAAIAGAITYVSQSDLHSPVTWINAVLGVIGAASVRSAIDKSAGPAVDTTKDQPAP